MSHTNANRLNKLKEQDAEEGKKADAIQDRVLDLVHGWSHYVSPPPPTLRKRRKC